MDYDHILKLSPEQLYSDAQKFKQSNEYDNYYIHLTMSANYKYKLAEQDLNIKCLDPIFYCQNYSNTVPFYEATKDYSYSSFILGWLYTKGIHFPKSNDMARKFYEQSILKGNELAYYYIKWVDAKHYDQYKQPMLDHLFETNQENRIYEICGYVSDNKIDLHKKIYQLKKENDKYKYKNSILEKENNELKTHIMASPDGQLYFEAKESWNEKISKS